MFKSLSWHRWFMPKTAILGFVSLDGLSYHIYAITVIADDIEAVLVSYTRYSWTVDIS